MDLVNPGKRTHGIVLKENYDCELPDTDIVTRKFNVEVYEQTGRLEYLEEGVKMANIDQRANGKKLRTEVTTIEQFNALGTYGEIAKKYKVSTAMAHALKMSLQAKKLREEKEEPVIQHTTPVDAAQPTLIQIEQFHTDEPVQALPEFEMEAVYMWGPEDPEPVGMTEEENMPDAHWEELNAINQSDHPELYEAVEKSEEISEETLKKIDERTKLLIAENEDKWLISGIEAQWADIEASLAEIRRMSIRRMDKEIKERLEMVMGELA